MRGFAEALGALEPDSVRGRRQPTGCGPSKKKVREAMLVLLELHEPLFFSVHASETRVPPLPIVPKHGTAWNVDEIGYPKKSSAHYKVSKSVLLTLYSV